jgi:putative addiction module component (TIGR02574 family)
MSTLAQLEKEVLNLPPEERERLVLAAWESIGDGCPLDSESIEIARRRDQEIESGVVKAISHDEFMRRTSASE